jgi:hypothetical protein
MPGQTGGRSCSELFKESFRQLSYHPDFIKIINILP